MGPVLIIHENHHSHKVWAEWHSKLDNCEHNHYADIELLIR